MSTDMRAITRELETARRILTNPDGHTDAELAYAEQRIRELGPVYIEAQVAMWRGVAESIEQWAANVIQAFTTAFVPMAPTIQRLYEAVVAEYPEMAMQEEPKPE